jgi:sodium/bile acid cotransporter 2
MTAVSTICSAVMLPLNLTIYLKLLGADWMGIEVPWADIFKGVITVVIAITTGVAISTKCPNVKRRMSLLGNVSGISMILLTAFAAVVPIPARKRSEKLEGVTPLWGKGLNFYVAVIGPFFASLIVSLLVSSQKWLKLTRPERVTVAVEVSYQNVGVASAVALAAFCHDPRKRSDAAAVPLIYGLVEAVALAVFCLSAWKAGWTYAPKNATFLSALRYDYQPCRSDGLSKSCDMQHEAPSVEPVDTTLEPKPSDVAAEASELGQTDPVAERREHDEDCVSSVFCV